jgi:hypothetical protein
VDLARCNGQTQAKGYGVIRKPLLTKVDEVKKTGAASDTARAQTEVPNASFFGFDDADS